MSQISKQNNYAQWLTALHNIQNKFSSIELTALDLNSLSQTIKASETNYIINDINNFINTYDFDITVIDTKNSGELIFLEDLNNINNTLEALENICVNNTINGTSTNGTSNSTSSNGVCSTADKTVKHVAINATGGTPDNLIHNTTGHSNYDNFN